MGTTLSIKVPWTVVPYIMYMASKNCIKLRAGLSILKKIRWYKFSTYFALCLQPLETGRATYRATDRTGRVADRTLFGAGRCLNWSVEGHGAIGQLRNSLGIVCWLHFEWNLKLFSIEWKLRLEMTWNVLADGKKELWRCDRDWLQTCIINLGLSTIWAVTEEVMTIYRMQMTIIQCRSCWDNASVTVSS